jgi:hypothetical protein
MRTGEARWVGGSVALILRLNGIPGNVSLHGPEVVFELLDGIVAGDDPGARRSGHARVLLEEE